MLETEIKDINRMVEGRPLAEIGLEGATVVKPDGAREPLTGIALLAGDSVADAVQRQFGVGARLYTAACRHPHRDVPCRYTGADDHSVETCRLKFSNVKRFDGFPAIPVPEVPV